VRIELQADYLTGLWAHQAERMKLLEEGDHDEALTAASAVGYDRIQKSTGASSFRTVLPMGRLSSESASFQRCSELAT